jgi:hypothetical protein
LGKEEGQQDGRAHDHPILRPWRRAQKK